MLNFLIVDIKVVKERVTFIKVYYLFLCCCCCMFYVILKIFCKLIFSKRNYIVNIMGIMREFVVFRNFF